MAKIRRQGMRRGTRKRSNLGSLAHAGLGSLGGDLPVCSTLTTSDPTWCTDPKPATADGPKPSFWDILIGRAPAPTPADGSSFTDDDGVPTLVVRGGVTTTKPADDGWSPFDFIKKIGDAISDGADASVTAAQSAAANAKPPAKPGMSTQTKVLIGAGAVGALLLAFRK